MTDCSKIPTLTLVEDSKKAMESLNQYWSSTEDTIVDPFGVARKTAKAIDDIFNEAEADAISAAQSANAAEAAASTAGYKGLWPDTGGSALKGETWQTQTGGTPTGEYYTALQDTSVDPVGDNVNWYSINNHANLTDRDDADAHPAISISTTDGRNVQERLDDLPSEVDAAGTAETLISQHNSDSQAHPELSAFITSEADRAETAAEQAELASDSVAVNADIYETVAMGIAGTGEGEQFLVLSDDLSEYVRYRHDAGGTATHVGSFPTPNSVAALQSSQAVAAQAPIHPNQLDPSQYLGLPDNIALGGAEISTYDNAPALRLFNIETNGIVSSWSVSAAKFSSGKVTFGFDLRQATIGNVMRIEIIQLPTLTGSAIKTDSFTVLPSGGSFDGGSRHVYLTVDIDPDATILKLTIFGNKRTDDPDRSIYIQNIYATDSTIPGFRGAMDAKNTRSENIHGNAVRIEHAAFVEKGSNLFNGMFHSNKSISPSTGELTDNAGLGVSDYIAIDPGKTYHANPSGRWALYDSALGFIRTGTSYPFTAEGRARYVRFSFGLSDSGSVIIGESSEALPYEPFKARMQSAVDENFERGNNLFPTDGPFYSGYTFNTSGDLTADSSRSATVDFITVEAGRELHCPFGFSAALVAYDAFGVVVERTVMTGSGSGFYTVPEGVTHIRLGMSTDNIPDFQLYYRDEVPTHFEPGGVKLSDKVLPYSRLLSPKGYSPTPDIVSGQYRANAALPWDDTYFANGPTYSVAELHSRWDDLISENSNYITKEVMGMDASNTHEVWRLTLTPQRYDERRNRPLPKILIFSTLHGMEETSAFDTYMFFRDLCENWKTDPLLRWLRWNCQFVVMPLVNPWGFQNNERKNYNGVDLNRNFVPGHTVGDPNDPYYGGPSPLSEVETQYVDATLTANTDAMIAFDHHDFSTHPDRIMFFSGTSLSGDDPVVHSAAIQCITDSSIDAQINYGAPEVWLGYVSYSDPAGMLKNQAWDGHRIRGMTFETSRFLSGVTGVPDGLRCSTEILGNTLLTFLRAFVMFDGR